MATLYDTIGQGYRDLRRPDPRIEDSILRFLGNTRTVVNVGAGAGSYEPADRSVIAIEPSMTMIGQRSVDAAPVVCATATSLPFADGAFDAALAILTLHHWPDRQAGLGELRRVARDRVVILTWDPAADGFWLTDYVPQILDIDRRIFPSLAELIRVLGPLVVADVPIPHDCSDGFLGAYWRRPRAYLEAHVRAAISTFSKVDATAGLQRLERDLESGAWDRRYGELLNRTELDLGYRLVVAA